MKRPYHIKNVLALIALCATAWMVALPQSAAAMSSSQDSATATIQGTVLKPDGSPAIGAEMKIAFTDQDVPNWQLAQVDPATATYEINVEPGTWRLLYALLPLEGPRGEYDAYQHSGEHIMISIVENQTVNQDMTLIAYNATVRGSVLAPDGTAISEGYVWVGGNYYEDMWITEPRRRVAIVDGIFEAPVVTGGQYLIQIDDRSSTFLENHWGKPDFYTITPVSDGTNEIVMQMLATDAQITGIVKLVVPGAPNIAVEDRESSPLANALVRVYTKNARNTVTESSIGMSGEGDYIARTDENGRFTVNVPSGKTYIIDTDMRDATDSNSDTPPMSLAGSDMPTVLEVAEPQAYDVELFALPVISGTEMDESSDANGETGPLNADSVAVGNEQMTEFVFLPAFVRQ